MAGSTEEPLGRVAGHDPHLRAALPIASTSIASAVHRFPDGGPMKIALTCGYCDRSRETTGGTHSNTQAGHEGGSGRPARADRTSLSGVAKIIGTHVTGIALENGAKVVAIRPDPGRAAAGSLCQLHRSEPIEQIAFFDRSRTLDTCRLPAFNVGDADWGSALLACVLTGNAGAGSTGSRSNAKMRTSPSTFLLVLIATSRV
jgi:hypothetical protein